VLNVRSELVDERYVALLSGCSWLGDAAQCAYQRPVVGVNNEMAAFQHELKVTDSP
jgi:hypothetical protein